MSYLLHLGMFHRYCNLNQKMSLNVLQMLYMLRQHDMPYLGRENFANKDDFLRGLFCSNNLLRESCG